jgi:hypothetical protein
VRFRFEPWQLAVVLVLICAGAIGLAQWWIGRGRYDAASMIQTLPEDRSVHLYVDLGMLRDAGLLDFLTSAKTPEEPDYRRFVDETGFDYRVDLDAVAAAFTGGNLYITARGQFEWAQLTAYAQAQGGLCANATCQMPASRPDRNISFYPLRRNVIALAVSTEPRGVNMISPSNWRVRPVIPPVPIWISAAPSKFADVSALPTGTHIFLSPLSQTKRAVFTLRPVLDSSSGLELKLEASSETPAIASDVARQMTTATDLLRRMLARDDLKASAADLSGVLTSGHFESKGSEITGAWAIDRRFIDNLLAGQVQ